jgi:hypothetical protein
MRPGNYQNHRVREKGSPGSRPRRGDPGRLGRLAGGESGPTASRPGLLANRWLVGGERGLGGLVVRGLAGIGGGVAQRPAVRTGSRRWASTRARGMWVREGWARANRAGVAGEAKAGCRERASIERAEGMDARSERPARWHGPAPSLREVNPPHRPSGHPVAKSPGDEHVTARPRRVRRGRRGA